VSRSKRTRWWKLPKARQAKSRANQIRVTQGGYLGAWAEMSGPAIPMPMGWDQDDDLAPERLLFARTRTRPDGDGGTELCWLDGTSMTARHEGIVGRWMGTDRLQSCGQTITVQGCSADRSHRAMTSCHCCNVPLCPRHQRRQSGIWVKRAEGLIDAMGSRRGYSWKMITIALKDEPDLLRDLDNHIDLRREIYQMMTLGEDPKTKKKFRNPFDAQAMIGSLEQAGTVEKPHIHLHLIVYCKHLDREFFQRWMRSRDCSVSNCDHPADTRGTDSKCDGSWYVDIRKLRCWHKATSGKCRCKTARKCQAAGVREAIKYASKPVGTERIDTPRAGQSPTFNELAWAGQVIKFAAHMYRRHRIESYGAAKPMITAIIRDADAEDAETPRGVCADCGEPMQVIYLGWSKTIRDGYEWGSPDRPGYERLKNKCDAYNQRRAEQLKDFAARRAAA